MRIYMKINYYFLLSQTKLIFISEILINMFDTRNENPENNAYLPSFEIY